MDPLSAFSLACNVLQFIEFGTKILTKASEYHSAPDGALEEQRNLRGVMQSLNGLNVDLASSLSTSSEIEIPPAKQKLIAANEQCLHLSNKFIRLLNSLKVNDGRSKLESLRMAIKSVWYKEKVQAMNKELTEARDNLNIALLVWIQCVAS
jgi:hypothetical protein